MSIVTTSYKKSRKLIGLFLIM